MTMSSEHNGSNLARDVVERLRGMFDGDVGLHEPSFEGNENTYVSECVESGWVSSVGKFVDRFEDDLAQITGASHVIAVVNGTAALHLALLLVGVEPSDEVLVPAISFVATANAVSYCQASPHFVDISERTLGLDPGKLDRRLSEIAEVRDDGHAWNRETGRRIRACVPMHTFGHPVEITTLVDVCDRWGISIVEDAAESLGSTYQGKHTGTFGQAGILSFNGNKIVTTGGGGAIITNDPELGRLGKHLSTTAKRKHAYEYVHDQVGYNYRLPNINAALGCAQLERLPEMVERKRNLAVRYQDSFRDLEGVRVFIEPKEARSNYWLNALILDSEHSGARDDILRTTNEEGIMTRPVWRMLPSLDIYGSTPKSDLSVSKSLEQRIINVPSSSFLGAS